MNQSMSMTAAQQQKLAISGRQMQGLKLLAMSLPELRAEIAAEMSANPAIEDMDHPLETPLSEVEAKLDREREQDEPDFPEDGYEPTVGHDEEAAERRQAFFDNLVKEETLQGHLVEQLPLSDIDPADFPMAEVLIGDLDEKGYYKGSLADVAMAFGKSEDEVIAVLAKIRDLDPPGCGSRTVEECLLSQLESIADPAVREDVRKIVSGHLADIEAGRIDAICKAHGFSKKRFAAALVALRSLDGRPGRQFPSERERVEFVNPEIHARKLDGRWIAETDERSLPEIRFSKSFEDLLKDKSQTAETKAYVRERIAAARAFREAIEKRRQTVKDIAQAVFDRQQDFFERGFGALKPLTELEVAASVGVHGTTVSRTVRDKYAETPYGTIELRRFFSTGVKTSAGETVSQEAVLGKLREIVDGEDKSNPLSDEKIAAELKGAGYPVARRTVAKYRDKLGIPGRNDRVIA